jgi:glycosyltransferase involved in cell wall biosynthesis
LNNPLLSVILTTHLRPTYLYRAIESLVNQTFTDFEIILVSDSYDVPTIDVAKDLLRKTDSLILNPNLIGPAESRNLGIQLSKGKWISFLDDDDAYSPNYLNEFIEKSQKIYSDIFYTNYIKVQEDRSNSQLLNFNHYQVRDINFELIMISNFIPSNCVFVNSNLAKLIKFDSKLNSHEDWDWLISLKQITTFEHIDIVGPIIYESITNSRNQDAHQSRQIAFDFLSIYRKWPTPNIETKQLRKKILMDLGLTVDESFL